MKYLKLFENHQTESEVARICQIYEIENWSLNSDGLIYVDGDVNFYNCGLTKLPLKFKHVTGYFDCDRNQLTSLEGAPHTVDYFYCGHNSLTSLEFAPKSVSSDFNCQGNNIRSFEGPVNIGGNFYCNDNPIWKIWHIMNPRTHIWDNNKMDFFKYRTYLPKIY